ncbi:unnamed protein product [Arabidopsis thaliana]|uniref:(thale cress) hypothetical protein n=1 Tax=Arabidopsis thaliana TaxID=3702 RepID=A0A7G2EA32_ARATH|nr:unnamed protein product [Arabidopsis thaliana]
MNQRRADDAIHGYSDGGDMPETNVPETKENEEIYRVNIDDDTHPLNEFTRDTFRVPVGRGEQQSKLNFNSSVRRGSGSQRSEGSSGAKNVGSRSRGNRRKQSFETTILNTIAGYTEFQRQSLQQFRSRSFDQEDYDEFKKAEAIFLALEFPRNTKFHWACIDTLKELKFWRKYFFDIVVGTNEEEIQLLEAMTSVSRNK